MGQTEFLSSTDVAKMLGLSVATVKRWVDSDILPAYKTAGGHRRFLLTDVQRLVKQRHLPRLDPSSLPATNERIDIADAARLASPLHSALLRNDLPQARSIIHQSHDGGLPMEAIADQIVGPAMTRIGNDWEKKRIDVYQEHQATRICETVLQELKPRVAVNAEKNLPIAIGGAPEHDPTVVPNLLIELLLQENGWAAVNLGPHTPLPSLAKAVADIKPRLVWISMSHALDRIDRFLSEYRELYNLAERLGIPVVIGGRAWEPAIRSQLTYTAFCDGLTQLAAFIRTINPRRTPRQRGRPSKSD